MSDLEYFYKRIGKRYGDFVIEDTIPHEQEGHQQKGLPRKVICLDKIRLDNSRIELRLGYYRENDGKWVWGRNATFVPPKDFKAIVDEATKRGLI